MVSDGLLACQECAHYQRWSHTSVFRLSQSGLEPKSNLNAKNILPKASSLHHPGLAALLWEIETPTELAHVSSFSCAHSVVSLSLQPETTASQSLRPWNFPGKNMGVGCHFLLQVIFPTQGLNPSLLGLLQ